MKTVRCAETAAVMNTIGHLATGSKREGESARESEKERKKDRDRKQQRGRETGINVEICCSGIT